MVPRIEPILPLYLFSEAEKLRRRGKAEGGEAFEIWYFIENVVIMAGTYSDQEAGWRRPNEPSKQ